MKIFCLLNNYGTASDDLDWYMIPDSGILRHDNPMFVPDFDKEFRGYPSLIVKICKLGKNVSAKFANRYYSEVAPGVAVQATELLDELRRTGKPWTRAVVFDKCCLVGEFITADEWNKAGMFQIKYGDKCFCWNSDKMIKGVNEVIETISRENILKTGDLVFVALSPDYFRLDRGMTLSARIGYEEKLQIRFK